MRRLLIAALILLVSTVSCGKGEVKKASQDSKTATEAFELMEQLKDAYLKKDQGTIEKSATKEGFRTIRSAIKSFDSAELTLNPVLVEINADEVLVQTSWKGTWRKSGKTSEERGVAVFVLKGKPLKVDNILRVNPFRYPE